MLTLRFLPQSTLDAWVDEGKVDLRPDRVVELATRAEFPAREALRFVKLESGADTAGLLHKVKPLAQVKALGAEYCLTSVILDETVYEVVPGWIAEVPAVPGTPPVAKAPEKRVEPQNDEADMLARLLLDKLS